MFMLNNAPLAPDTAFTVGEGDAAIQYPANWLRLASPEECAALGITEVADPVRADDRFYWNGDINTPKALEDEIVIPEDGQDFESYNQKGLKSVFIAQVKQTAASLLVPTDWKVTRAAEGIKPVDAETLAARAAIRDAIDTNEAAIEACTSTEELAALSFTWPAEQVAA